MNLRIVEILFLLIAVFFTILPAENLMEKADSFFEQRNAVFDTNKILADNANIDQAIFLYKKIIETSADAKYKEEAAWKILQAYFFKALFTTTSNEEKVKIFSEAVKTGEKILNEFSESVAVNCWFGIDLGYMGEYDSKLNSMRNNIPARVKKIAEKVIALDENYLDAGGYRMYGRLHYIVPNVPMVMNWPSKKKSVEYLEKACKIAPDNLFNKLYLAETLLDQGQTERAVKMLKSIVNDKRIHHDIAVDTFIKKKAKSLLGKHQSKNITKENNNG